MCGRIFCQALSAEGRISLFRDILISADDNVITLKVWPDLGPNCLKGLSADDSVLKRFKGIIQTSFYICIIIIIIIIITVIITTEVAITRSNRLITFSV